MARRFAVVVIGAVALASVACTSDAERQGAGSAGTEVSTAPTPPAIDGPGATDLLSTTTSRTAATAPGTALSTPMTASSVPAPTADPGALDRLAAALLGGEDLDAGSEALARAGVTTHHDDARSVFQPAAAPSSPLRVARYQVSGLVAGRTPAAELDALMSPPEGVPLSHLVAGYVARGDTFGADLSRRLMAGQDLLAPGALVFPNVTLALFVADVLPPEGGRGPQGARTPAGEAGLGPATAASFCADLQAFLEGTLASITEAAKAIAADLPVIGAIVSFAGEVLGLAADAIAALVGSVPFIEGFKTAIAVVGILIVAVSALQPWPIEVDAENPFPHYGIIGEPATTDRFTATVTTGGDPFDVIRPCAEIAGISLPEAETAVGAPVTWTLIQGFGDHLIETGRDDTIAADGTARLHFQLQQELRSVHAHGREESAVALVRATVDRGTIDLISQLADAVFGSGVLDGVIGKLLGPTLIAEADAALTKILALADAQGVGTALVGFHVAQPAQFTIQFDYPDSATTIEGSSCNGLEGPWQVTVTTVGKTFSGGGSGTGTFTLPGGDQPGQLLIVHSVTIAGASGAHSYDLTASAVGDEAVVMHLDGTDTAHTIGGDFSHAFTASAPVTFGGECGPP